MSDSESSFRFFGVVFSTDTESEAAVLSLGAVSATASGCLSVESGFLDDSLPVAELVRGRPRLDVVGLGVGGAGETACERNIFCQLALLFDCSSAPTK